MSILYIDPALISSGWALFIKGKLDCHGTIVIEKKNCTDGKRYHKLYIAYTILFHAKLPDEVHIEQTGGRPHHKFVKACGIIEAAGAYYGSVQDIPVSSWQKFTDWKGERKMLEPYKDKVKSEDELSAIGMGLWHTNKKTSTK